MNNNCQSIKSLQLPCLLLLFTIYIPTVKSFALQYGTVTNSPPFSKMPSLAPMKPSMSMVAPSAFSDVMDTSSQETGKLYDPNSKEFLVGGVVRVVKKLKAYQVSPKGFGKFDEETKEFITSPKDSNRANSSLIVPIGLRGVIKRVYDIDEFDANQPIIVKFQPGVNVDEGYDPPLTFMMHFHENELECV